MKKLLLLLLIPCFVQAQSDSLLSAPMGELTWRSMPTVAREHTGSIQISKGGITFEFNGKIVRGDIELDMKSVKNFNAESNVSAKGFEDKMSSAKFLATEEFPKATISFVGTRYDFNPFNQTTFGLTVLLTVKGSTERMNLPATIRIDDKGILTLKTIVPLNRTKEDVQQASVFSFISLRDEVAANDLEIIITIDLKAAGC